MDDQESQKQATRSRNRDEKTDRLLEKARAEARAAKAQAKAREKANLKAAEDLLTMQKALAAAQAELEQEHRARIEAESALVTAERVLSPLQDQIDRERQRMGGTEESEAKNEMIPPEEETAIKKSLNSTSHKGVAAQRLSFIVRVTTDNKGRPLRTEIEHVQSDKKVAYPAFDPQRIGAFIETCAQPVVSPSSEEIQQSAHTLEPEKVATSLLITEVRPVRKPSSEERELIFAPNKAFDVRVEFALRGPDVVKTTASNPGYEIRVFAQDINQGNTIEVVSKRARLELDRLDYSLTLESKLLAPGLYRLLTFITLPISGSKGGYYEGPIFQVGKPEGLLSNWTETAERGTFFNK